MKRGKCNSSLCRANEALTKYLDKLIDDERIKIDKERNSNKVILEVCVGNLVQVHVEGKDKKNLIVPVELYEVLYNLCEHENEDE